MLMRIIISQFMTFLDVTPQRLRETIYSSYCKQFPVFFDQLTRQNPSGWREIDILKRLSWISWGIEDIWKSEIPMINIIFSEFTISFDNLHPNEENLNLIPSIPLSWLSIHGQIKEIGLKIPENHDKSTKSTSIHNEIIDKLIFPHRLMQRYLIKSLFELSIPEAIESVDFSDIVMFSNSGDVKVHLRIQLVVMIYYGAYWGLKVEIHTFIQLEVSQRVHDPTLDTNSVHFDCIFA